MGVPMTLRDKLQALTAPSRECDWEIAECFGEVPEYTPLKAGKWSSHHPHRPWKEFGKSYQLCIHTPRDSEGRNYTSWSPARYTASLDATVELVEREMLGKNWSVVRFEDSYAIATLGDADRVISEGEHIIPAVALLLALLEAKGVE